MRFKYKGKFSKIKLIKEFALFGCRLTYFTNFWFLVWIIGLFVAAITSLEEIHRNFSPDKPSLDAGTILNGAKGIILATFVAVITSVMVDTFHQIKEHENIFNRIHDKVVTIGNSISAALSLISGALSQLESYKRSLLILAANELFSRRIKSIEVGADKIIKEGSGASTGEALRRLCKEFLSFSETLLYPLLPPGQTPTVDDVANSDDDIISKTVTTIGDEPSLLPHFSFAAATTSRLFLTERLERYFPGVMLNVSTFAYYIRTIQEVVDAFKGYHDKFEFYTFMPQSPVDLFRFKNSAEFDEWLTFLEGYNQFQKDGKGKWKRYFGYKRDASTLEEYTDWHGIGGAIKNSCICAGYKDKDWLPIGVKSSDVESYVAHITDSWIKTEVLKKYKAHDGVGTFISDERCENCMDTSKGGINAWKPISDVLLKYHYVDPDVINDIIASKLIPNAKKKAIQREIDDKFVYVCVEELNVGSVDITTTTENGDVTSHNPFISDFKYDIESRYFKVKSEDKNEKAKKHRRFVTFPRDFFAIRDRNKSGVDAWVYFIGFDDMVADKNIRSSVSVALSQIIDLDVMAHETSESINHQSAGQIRNILQKVFIDADTKSHAEILVNR